ncbi:MAG: cation:proton antiporter [Geitlerinemataceae cyanobacterium]
MDASFLITLSIVLTVVAGIGAQVLAEYLKIPGIVFLLIFGIALGPSGTNWLRPEILGDGLETLVSLSVALILFEGGLSLGLRELDRVSGSLRNLVTIGTLITFVGGGMAAHWLGEFPWTIAFLYASLIVVTGPTVIGPLLKQVQADRQVSTLLEGEGVLIDPVGAILAVLVLDVVVNGDADLVSLLAGLALRLGLGIAIGGAGGWLMGWFVKRASFLSDDLKNLFVLAGVWGLFAIAQLLVSESGLMATVAAGLVLRASSLREERLLRRFKGQLTTLAVSVLFVLLAADLSIASIVALGWGSLLTVAVLMFVVRPINIWVCTWNSDLNWRQKVFAGWIAPRGIVSASVSSLFAILLVERGVNGGDAIKALVFLTIVVTVIVQGLTAKPLAQALQIQAASERGALIVGSNPLSRLVAQLFQQRGESVMLIDTDAEACEAAEQENIPVLLSSAFDTDVLEEAGLGSIGTFVTMTSNGEVNAVLAQRAMEEFSPPRTLALLPKDSTKKANGTKVQQALKQDFPIKLWNQRLRDGTVRLGETMMREPGFAFQQSHVQKLIQANSLVPLLVERNGNIQLMPSQASWQSGDRLIYLFHSPKPELLRRLSGGNQPSQSGLKIETIPEVEKIDIPNSVIEDYEDTLAGSTKRDIKRDTRDTRRDAKSKASEPTATKQTELKRTKAAKKPQPAAPPEATPRPRPRSSGQPT